MQAADVQIPKKEHYTHADYTALPEGAPYQLIDGELVMSPAPNIQHQRIVLHLVRLLSELVEEHNLGEVFVSPVDVHLSEKDTPQPDVVFVARERLGIVGEQEIEGAPDLIVEVLSPSTAYYDLKKKKRLYQRSGVKEYWIVDPQGREIEIYENAGERFELVEQAEGEGRVASRLLEGFAVELADVF